MRGSGKHLIVVVVAEEAAGVQVLEALRRAPGAPEIAAVVTTTEPARKRRPVVAEAAARLGLEVREASEAGRSSFAGRLRERGVDVLVNVHSLVLLDAAAVAAPRIGSFNLHPGPLPEYAGLNAPSWAIYNGEEKHGVTLHWMDAGIDSGPIAYQSFFPIENGETGLSLTGKCVRHGVPLVARLITDAAQDPSAIQALEQDRRKRRYFGREIPNGGTLSWSAPAREVVRFVRAADYGPFVSPWGIPRAELRGRPVGIAKASVTGERTDEPPGTVGNGRPRGAITVAAGDEWIEVQRIWRDGRYLRPGEICTTGDRLRDGRGKPLDA